MRKVLPIILLSLTYFVGQAYELYDNAKYDALGKVSWMYDNSHPMLISWNVKYLSENIIWVMVVVAFLLIIKYPTKLNKLAALEYLLYRILDIVFYLYNFKTQRYWYLFFILGIVMAIIYLRKEFNKKQII